MLGARLGCLHVSLEASDLHCLHDYAQLGQLWTDAKAAGTDDWSVFMRLRELGDHLRRQLGLEEPFFLREGGIDQSNGNVAVRWRER